MASSDGSGHEETTTKVAALEATEVTDKTTDAYAFMFHTRPMVRDCDWHEFKNRYPEDGGWCAIKTLLSSLELHADIAFEQLDRKSKDRQRSRPRATVGVKPEPQSGCVDIQRLERVRINSAFILAYLAKVTGEHSWSRKPHTFLRPFRMFIHYHSKMKDEFGLL